MDRLSTVFDLYLHHNKTRNAVSIFILVYVLDCITIYSCLNITNNVPHCNRNRFANRIPNCLSKHIYKCVTIHNHPTLPIPHAYHLPHQIFIAVRDPTLFPNLLRNCLPVAIPYPQLDPIAEPSCDDFCLSNPVSDATSNRISCRIVHSILHWNTILTSNSDHDPIHSADLDCNTHIIGRVLVIKHLPCVTPTSNHLCTTPDRHPGPCKRGVRLLQLEYLELYVSVAGSE